MDIKINAKVQCQDKPAGQVSAVILDPIKDELTHIVVKYQGEEYEVEVSHIVYAEDDELEITLTTDMLRKQTPFTETEFIRSPMEHDGYMDTTGLYYRPFVTMEMVGVKHKHIPQGEVDFTRSTVVYATDGRIGKIDELVVNPNNYHISHIVLREGHIWKQKDVVVGVEHINHVNFDGVHLDLSKAEVEALPTLAIKRYFGFKVSQ